MLTRPAETLEVIPVIIDANSSQVEYSLGTWLSPAHARLFHAILDRVTANTFDDTGADGPTLHQILVVAHIGRVTSVVADGDAQRPALGR